MTVKRMLWISLLWGFMLTTNVGADTSEPKLHTGVSAQVPAEHKTPDTSGKVAAKPSMEPDGRERGKVATAAISLPSTIEKMQF